MLKKSKRLGSTEVEAVLKGGRSVRSDHLQIKLLSGSLPLRSAAIVAKAVARKATARNSLRRALYRALAASDTSQISGLAVFFIRAVPKGKVTPTLQNELSTLLPALISGLTRKKN